MPCPELVTGGQPNRQDLEFRIKSHHDYDIVRLVIRSSTKSFRAYSIEPPHTRLRIIIRQLGLPDFL